MFSLFLFDFTLVYHFKDLFGLGDVFLDAKDVKIVKGFYGIWIADFLDLLFGVCFWGFFW